MADNEKQIQIRLARIDEAKVLTDLSIRSKAYWGYSDEFMEAWAPELVIHPEYVATSRVWVSEREGRPVGFVGLSYPESPPELVFLFVEPSEIGKGVGTCLWNFALNRARMLEWKSFLIIGDPNAEGFYLKLGASRIGEKEYAIIPGRKIPVLEFVLSD